MAGFENSKYKQDIDYQAQLIAKASYIFGDELGISALAGFSKTNTDISTVRIIKDAEGNNI